MSSVRENGNRTLSLGCASVLGFPEFNLLRVECRPQALLARGARVTTLLSPTALPDAEAAARALAESVLGGQPFEAEAPPRVHRTDLTVDVVHDGDLDIGRNALFAAAQVRLAHWGPAKADPSGSPAGFLEGAIRASRSQLEFRAYDKAHELSKPKHRIKTADGFVPHPDAGAAGRWLRLERQYRPTSTDKRPTTAALAGDAEGPGLREDPAMASTSRAEYRFSWWHQGLLMYDHAYEWSADLHEITSIKMRSWLVQDESRSVTFIAPGGDLFGSTNAPLTVVVHEIEPEIDPAADRVADFDLVVESGRLDLEPSGGGEGLTSIELPAGQWRARWSGFGEMAAIEQAYPSDVLVGGERPDHYRMEVWPTEVPAPVVIHRGD